MNNKLKVLTLVGTRPEIIKLSLVINELEKYTDHVLVHSGQNFDYELNEIFFNDLNIKKPDFFLESVGATTAATIGNIISKLDEILEKENPDAFVVYGDTNSCLGVISAKKRKIPIFHMEAGNRCFDQRVPEEVNRKIVDHLSDINFVHSEHARRYLLNEGIKPETIMKTGSPMVEIFEHYKDQISSSSVLENLKLEKDNYFVVSIHREENVDSDINFTSLLDTLEKIAAVYQKRIIVSTHPRTRKKLEERKHSIISSKIEFMKPLGFFDYINLQKNSYCTISDSGTITEESSILKFHAVTVRQAHERPEGMDRAAIVMSDLYSEAVIRSVNLVRDQNFRCQDIEDYDSTDFSKKVVRIIFSYVDYVNRTVWRK